MTAPNGKKTWYDYSLRGEQVHTWRDVPNPEERVYDIYGNLVQLRTYRAGTGWNGSVCQGVGSSRGRFLILTSGAHLQLLCERRIPPSMPDLAERRQHFRRQSKILLPFEPRQGLVQIGELALQLRGEGRRQNRAERRAGLQPYIAEMAALQDRFGRARLHPQFRRLSLKRKHGLGNNLRFRRTAKLIVKGSVNEIVIS